MKSNGSPKWGVDVELLTPFGQSLLQQRDAVIQSWLSASSTPTPDESSTLNLPLPPPSPPALQEVSPFDSSFDPSPVLSHAASASVLSPTVVDRVTSFATANGYSLITPLAEYPRPQLRRDSYMCLNGYWDYAIRPLGRVQKSSGVTTRAREGEMEDWESIGEQPATFDGQILVPFSPESALSGVSRQLQPSEVLWYHRIFHVYDSFWPSATSSGRSGKVWLHFGAVDQVATVYINGARVVRHAGGYLPFRADVTPYLVRGKNRLVVRVRDSTAGESKGGVHAYGKQKAARGGIWYTAQSGIWQTVWMEYVPNGGIDEVTLTPELESSSVNVMFKVDADSTTPVVTNTADNGSPEDVNPAYVRVTVLQEGSVVAEQTVLASAGRCTLKISGDVRKWCPADPFLYDVVLQSGSDRVESYIGMRSITREKDPKTNRWMMCLNGQPLFQSGLLDQGYWSDGLYTPATDSAMVYDIELTRHLGFNMLRKHIKIEPLRWYYHCDRLGMLVWQDMVSGGSFNSLRMQVLPFIGVTLKDCWYFRFGRSLREGREQFEKDLKETVLHLKNVTSLMVWVPFNEGWGQFDALRIEKVVRELDPTRLVDHVSGWHDQGGGDFKSRHVYYKPVSLRPDKGERILALTEFGGYSLALPGHMACHKVFGYEIYNSPTTFLRAMARLFAQEVVPYVRSSGLCATVYTQLSDVEDEVNGLVTYDRRRVKVDVSAMLAINASLRLDATDEEIATAANLALEKKDE